MNRPMARSLLYNALSLCYTYPDGEVSEWLFEGRWIREVEMALDSLALDSLKDPLHIFDIMISKKKEEFSSDLRREYWRLFTGGPNPLISPCASDYILDETASGDVSKFGRIYREQGFVPKEGLRDQPDHIVNELEFLSVLANCESEAPGSRRIELEEVQMDFFVRFFLPWGPIFCERVIQESRLSFYTCLARMTREFISFERNYLGVPEVLLRNLH